MHAHIRPAGVTTGCHEPAPRRLTPMSADRAHGVWVRIWGREHSGWGLLWRSAHGDCPRQSKAANPHPVFGTSRHRADTLLPSNTCSHVHHDDHPAAACDGAKPARATGGHGVTVMWPHYDRQFDRHAITAWSLCDHYAITAWSLCGHHMVAIWSSHDHDVVNPRPPCDHHATWHPCDGHVATPS